MRRLISGLLLAAFLAAPAALAHHAGESYAARDVVVSHAWTHENAPSAHANAVFLTIVNDGDQPDRLTGVTGDFFSHAEIQAPVLDDAGVLRTQTIASLEIAPGQSLTLQPGGVQIQLIGLQSSHFPGDHFDLTLQFEKAGALTVEVEVEPLRRDDAEEPDSNV
ncbi:copper chaperone PCu(A)C [Aquibaculum arenosum]|uniref:Copper chaperone PCu(A)C n=1 Tax=Aquibaculum arenosum TaxID=3032591 RepID=A0ABT5YN52_9PROT|nr:copper chaperone PCu(A)C [Fodinicurvata sp. CAU 1616]MDF2096267.1 copper chaperone PCu(A)C [Fodinicurvata sp. CAU 1616]